MLYHERFECAHRAETVEVNRLSFQLDFDAGRDQDVQVFPMIANLVTDFDSVFLHHVL